MTSRFKIFVNNTWEQIGDVVAPVSAVDNNLAAYDGVTGRLIKDSGVLTSDVSSAISASHTQGTDTALGALGTKDPPIDADKVIYRDSTATDALVTSTWTQVKAFLKTYFDTLYAAAGGVFVTDGDKGDITVSSTGTVWTADNDAIIAKVLTAFTAGAGTVAATDTILEAFQKVVGNIALKLTANVAITGATKTKITYDANGLVTAGADATTADIADSTDRRYVTDADLVDIGNLSGTNTGDVTLASPNHGLGLTGQVIALGTPSTITEATTNAVTTTTHTHAQENIKAQSFLFMGS